MATLSPEIATEKIRNQWAQITHPALRELREVFQQFAVRSIVDYRSGLVYAERPHIEEKGIGDFWFLAPPVERETIKAKLVPVGLADNVLVVDFLFYFGGISEDAVLSGHFQRNEEPLPRFTDSWNGEIEGFNEWEGAFMFYWARNGCVLLLDSSGRTAWWVMQERRVELYSDTFEEFIHKFTEYRRESWPFDYYGIPEKRLRRNVGS